jgi:uncharacterized protein YjiS (DUF1127 family)
MSVTHFTAPPSALLPYTPPASLWLRLCAHVAAGLQPIGRLIKTAIYESRARRASRELHRLDDRTLRDIGLYRCGIDYAVRHGRDVEFLLQWPPRG